jgi:hypothetical protein
MLGQMLGLFPDGFVNFEQQGSPPWVLHGAASVADPSAWSG